MGSFDGRVALVTGGAKGIGRGIVEGFLREGAAVAVMDTDALAAREVVAAHARPGARAVAVEADVASAADAARAVAETVAAFGRLDVLVNNAGIQPSDAYARIEELAEEHWDRILGVNLKGAFLMSRAAIPAIRASGRGCIVNMASVQGLQSMPRVPAYAASKGGLLSLTRNMALDYARDGIRVVAVAPGTIDSDLVRRLAREEGGDEEANVQRYGSFHPLGRIGRPDDVAEAVLFLSGDRASFITGEYLCVDGGFMAQGAWASSAGAED